MLVTAGGLSPFSQPAPCLPSSWSQYSPCFTFSWSLSPCAVPPFQLVAFSLHCCSLPADITVCLSFFQLISLSACLSSSWYPCQPVFLPADITVCLSFFQLISLSACLFSSWSLSACCCISLLADTAVNLYRPPDTAVNLYRPPDTAVNLYRPPDTAVNLFRPSFQMAVPPFQMIAIMQSRPCLRYRWSLVTFKTSLRFSRRMYLPCFWMHCFLWFHTVHTSSWSHQSQLQQRSFLKVFFLVSTPIYMYP